RSRSPTASGCAIATLPPPCDVLHLGTDPRRRSSATAKRISSARCDSSPPCAWSSPSGRSRWTPSSGPGGRLVTMCRSRNLGFSMRRLSPCPPIELIASYHPSQRNTQTGLLTETMLDEVFRGARRLLEGGRGRLFSEDAAS